MEKKFKVGDKVKIASYPDSDRFPGLIGATATVIDNDNPYTEVHFDDPEVGYADNVKPKNRNPRKRAILFHEDELELI